MTTITPKNKQAFRRGAVSILTEQETVLIHMCMKYGTKDGPGKAAEALEVPLEDLKKQLRTTRVRNYLQQYQRAFIQRMAQYELEKIAEYGVTRESIISGLYALSLCPPELTKGTVDGQVEALKTIADILGLKFNPRDADVYFKDKTPVQLKNYALYGKFELTEEEENALADAASKPAGN